MKYRFQIIILTLPILFAQCNSTTEKSVSADELPNEASQNNSVDVALDFTKNQPDGTPFSLSSLRGKYVLLDFWGSWCRPCRESHPHLKELYEKYKSYGFEIVGVAQEGGGLERARSSWLKAIEEDELTWIQVLNDEGQEERDIADLYSVNAYPTKVLLDKEGEVIYRDIGSDISAIEEKLKDIFESVE